ncbi:glycosyl transferase family 2 [Advenella kashmirensis W13003]|uniref:Glycosyl transferase family 2 n=1 Tax=Advenella kashmirensis W13003 TaxID=1424334 RepID=V8QV68_9BURK|nr:glycosyltransferase [Advenella kashmirensis]ETF03841.1 glycosyl transferase family 2 [Advenella kashmirensis W13003]
MSTDTHLQLSVVVPTYRRPDLLERCLDALQRQTLFPSDYEIIVCDDGPSAMVRDVIRNALSAMPNGPEIRYLEITETQGPAGARNKGWQRARAAVIAFTDDDTIPNEGWLAAGLRAMHAGAEVVAGRISMPLPTKPSDIELDAAGLEQAGFVTANCFVRRSILNELGGFDERFSMAWREDSDLHFTLLESGYAIQKEPGALVVHPLRPAKFAAGIAMQKKVLFDVLLYQKHPKLYRTYVRKGLPWLYIAISSLAVLALLSALSGRLDLASIFIVLWVLFTLRFFLTRLARSAPTMRNTLELLLTSIVIPPLSIYWRFVGMSRYGAWFP